MVSQTIDLLPLAQIVKANNRLKKIVARTPLVYNAMLSEKFQCEVFLKREDLQVVRSYKLRGAYNRMAQMSKTEKEKGIICASAGNHAQGVAYACYKLGIKGTIYMPETTPRQKISKVRSFGKEMVEIVLSGDTYDQAYDLAHKACEAEGKVFIHPFNDPEVMAGQGTVGMEILADSNHSIDFLFLPVGGGGLASGVGSYFKQVSPGTSIIGVEPEGAPAMYESLKQNKLVRLQKIEKFVDGAAVEQVGDQTLHYCKQILDDMHLVPEGKVCATILELYNEEAIVAEPAGALSIAALDHYAEQIKGKCVVCIVSGGNNDVMRMEDIKERALLYEGLKHYFLIKFPQRAGALREFLVNVLGPKDDIAHFEYTKKNNRDTGPALVGIELESKADYQSLLDRMEKYQVQYQVVNNNPMLFNLLV
ncbi:MAG: threonine ammonia-lyase [Bacteroidetes bacterium]|nr:threonine ammonia-lyase [Bacteroidota bacterium]